MTPRSQRKLEILVIVAGVSLAVFFVLRALDDSMLYFIDPTEVANGEAPANRAFNLGGMVEAGSMQRAAGSLAVQFVLTDFRNRVTVEYEGVLPDLFREGQGVIATGRLADDGRFQAERVLAKHDENYMPPNVADSLKEPEDGADGT